MAKSTYLGENKNPQISIKIGGIEGTIAVARGRKRGTKKPKQRDVIKHLVNIISNARRKQERTKEFKKYSFM